MHEVLADKIVERVRKRIAQGDCPSIKAESVETLEQVVENLAQRLDRARAVADSAIASSS